MSNSTLWKGRAGFGGELAISTAAPFYIQEMSQLWFGSRETLNDPWLKSESHFSCIISGLSCSLQLVDPLSSIHSFQHLDSHFGQLGAGHRNEDEAVPSHHWATADT